MLVRYNPDGDAEMNERQTERLKRLADWLHANDRKFLFELLVPAEDDQLESVGGDTDRYDAELRPELMRRVIEHFQNDGVEVDIWKIEGVDTPRGRARCSPTRPARARAARTSRACCSAAAPPTRRSTTGCARPRRSRASSASRSAARSGGTPLKGFLDEELERDAAADQIADNYLRFIKVYDEAATSVSA